MKKTAKLKQLFSASEILVMPCAYDALSAKIIEQVGFTALIAGGGACSICTLGRPDVGLMTLTEMTDQIWRITDVVEVPVFADGDNGHGNVTNVIRTIRDFERAGAAGFFIEDQVAPKRCGHRDGKQIIPPQEMVAKIKAAVDHRRDEDFVVTARTDALAVEGLQATLDRVGQYEDAGAEVILVDALTTEEEMTSVNRAARVPTMTSQIEGGRTPTLTNAQLQSLGFGAVLYPGTSFFAATYAVRRAMEDLHRNGTTVASRNNMIEFAEMDDIIGLAAVRDTEDKYNRESLAAG